MISINLDEESKRNLFELLQIEQTTSEELVGRLVREYHERVCPRQSVLERMGGLPKHLLQDGNLADRDSRRAIIADKIQAKRRSRA